MSVFLDDLVNRGSASAVRGVVHSIEGSIYRLSVVIDGSEKRVLDTDGKSFKRRSIQEVREALQGTCVSKLVLRQESAYDEMIGQCVRVAENTLEVPLAFALESDKSSGS